jgi:hypothetical protein
VTYPSLASAHAALRPMLLSPGKPFPAAARLALAPGSHPTIPLHVQGSKHRAVFSVAPDYLGVQTAEGLYRLSLSPDGYNVFRRELGWEYPCPGIVRAVWSSATTVLPLFTQSTRDVDACLRHQTNVAAALQRKPAGPGFVVGAQKDVIVGRGKPRHGGKDRVVIYGWTFSKTGVPLQTVFDKHSRGYVDYSHGWRPVHPTVQLDGESVPYQELLLNSNVTRDLFGEEYTWTTY